MRYLSRTPCFPAALFVCSPVQGITCPDVPSRISQSSRDSMYTRYHSPDTATVCRSTDQQVVVTDAMRSVLCTCTQRAPRPMLPCRTVMLHGATGRAGPLFLRQFFGTRHSPADGAHARVQATRVLLTHEPLARGERDQYCSCMCSHLQHLPSSSLIWIPIKPHLHRTHPHTQSRGTASGPPPPPPAPQCLEPNLVNIRLLNPAEFSTAHRHLGKKAMGCSVTNS